MEMAETTAKQQQSGPSCSSQLTAKRQPWIFAAVALLSVLVYANSLRNDFVWDDNELIVDNPAVHSLSDIPVFFTGDFWSQSSQPSARGYYRPMVLVSYAVDYALWGEHPAGFHLTNMFLHAVAAMLVCMLVLQLSEKVAAALVAGILFAVLPVHVESVAFISGRTDVLATVFVLSALCLYLAERKREAFSFRLPLALLLFGIGLLSKEVAAVLPALLLAVEMAKPSPMSFRRKLLLHMPFWLVLVGYLGVRFGLLHINPHIEDRLSVTEILLTMPAVALDYLRLLILPINLCADYAVPVQRTVSPENLAALVVLLAGMILAGWSALKRRLTGLFIFWILLCLLPVLQIVPISVLKAERFLYLPSVGFCAVGGMAGVYIYKQAGSRGQNFFMAGCLCVVVVFSLLTMSRNTIWRNELRLYEQTAARAPDNFRVQYNLGNAYFRAGELVRALAHTELAYSLKPDFPQIAYNLGVMYETAKDPEKAEHMYREAIRLKPEYALAHNNLAALLFAEGKYDEAESEWLKAQALDPNLPQPRQGLFLLNQQRYEQP
jgi:tetratricopeptide (TPR) repeat protein